MRIAASNNLAMDEALRLYERGAYLEQNLFGAIGLRRAGHDVAFLPMPGGAGRWLTSRSHARFGDLGQQRLTLRSGADLHYAGAEGVLTAVAVLRAWGAVRAPVVAVFHSPPPANRTARAAARGYDHAFALSRVAHASLLHAGRSPDTTHLLRWGPQLDHPAYVATARDQVVSCGKSLRDIDLLTVALDGRRALIYAPMRWTGPPNVTVRHYDAVQSHLAVLRDMARASVVAIPFRATHRMVGLTELNDALALGKPVVMTRSPHIDVDVEAVGCGFWVDPGDVEGWRRALGVLADDPELARAMGRRGRAFAEREWNAAACGRQVADALAMQQRTPAGRAR